MKAKRYKPQPARRVYIPKDEHSTRPLGLPALEDKIVQKGIALILEAIYEADLGLSQDDDVITYCRIGERSSHTWFALTHLLGFPTVRNYDGSWTEWGNLVGVPIER